MIDFINILVRTSNRPSHFKRCINSIKSQSVLYPSDRINIIVLNDNNDDYAKNEKDVLYIKVDRLEKVDKKFDDLYQHFPYNLYFNEGLKHVKNGRVIFLDDDDYILKLDYFYRLSMAKKPVTICKALLDKDKRWIVPGASFGKRVKEFDISGITYSVESNIAIRHKWDAYKVADYRYIKSLVDEIGEDQIEWIDEVYTGCQTIQHGGIKIE